MNRSSTLCILHRYSFLSSETDITELLGVYTWLCQCLTSCQMPHKILMVFKLRFCRFFAIVEGKRMLGRLKYRLQCLTWVHQICPSSREVIFSTDIMDTKRVNSMLLRSLHQRLYFLLCFGYVSDHFCCFSRSLCWCCRRYDLRLDSWRISSQPKLSQEFIGCNLTRWHLSEETIRNIICLER